MGLLYKLGQKKLYPVLDGAFNIIN